MHTPTSVALFYTIKNDFVIMGPGELMKIYTKRGDEGLTDLVGARVKKNDPRVEAYGLIDEAIASIGIISSIINNETISEELIQAQRMLFAICSELATTKGTIYTDTAMVDSIEAWIDAHDAQLPELRHFILPGGTLEAAQAHLARTIVRNSERMVVTIMDDYEISPLIPKILNRMSDYLFVVGRMFNHLKGIEDVKK
jgi:cob(I)alamin adenosyltransferase